MAGTAPSSSDCVAYWALEDLTDKTGNGHTLTNSGATSGATGILDDCYSWDDTNDILQNSSITDFKTSVGSISFWFKKASQSASHALVAFGESTGNDYLWVQTRTTGYLRFATYFNSKHATAEYQTDVCDGNWHHVVWTNDGTNNKYYFDGSDITSSITYVSGSDGGTWTGDLDVDNVALGAMERANSTGFFMGGYLDEASYYDVVLTADNVTYLYNSGSPTSTQQFPFGAVDAQAIMMGMNF